MKTVGVDLSYLKRLAQNQVYDWMLSLAPLRRVINQAQRQGARYRSCSSCRKPQPAINSTVVEAVARNQRFLSEMKQLKAMIKADKLIVNVGSVRTTI